MIRFLFLVAFSFCVTICYAQPNCNIYKWNNDNSCYKACLEATKALDFDQGSKKSQLCFDTALVLCPMLDYGWYEKSVPYLKRGDFITWKILIDKAVALNPTEYLGTRGWCRYKFLKDYEGAIKDIERLDSLSYYDIGFSGDGDYHLDILKALCYKAIGQKQKAIDIIEKQLKTKNYSVSLYDYLHLGVLKFETGNYKEAIASFKNGIKTSDCLAETHYYLALAYKKSNKKAEYDKNLLIAKDFYLAGKRRGDPYTDPMDKIYLSDIENEMKQGW